jgi:hypothetical protein
MNGYNTTLTVAAMTNSSVNFMNNVLVPQGNLLVNINNSAQNLGFGSATGPATLTFGGVSGDQGQDNQLHGRRRHADVQRHGQYSGPPATQCSIPQIQASCLRAVPL